MTSLSSVLPTQFTYMWSFGADRSCAPASKLGGSPVARPGLALPVNLEGQNGYDAVFRVKLTRSARYDDRRVRMGVNRPDTTILLLWCQFTSRTRRWPLLMRRAVQGEAHDVRPVGRAP